MEENPIIKLTDLQIDFLNNKDNISGDYKDWACTYHLERELKKLNITSYKSLLNKLFPESKSKSKSKSKKQTQPIIDKKEVKKLSDAIIDNFYTKDNIKKLYIPKEAYPDLIKSIPILSDEECKKYLDKSENIGSIDSNKQANLAINKALDKLPNELISEIKDKVKISNINQKKAIILRDNIEELKKELKRGIYPEELIDNRFIPNKIFSNFIINFQEEYFGKTNEYLFINNFTSVSKDNYEDLYNLYKILKISDNLEDKINNKSKLLNFLRTLYFITEGDGIKVLNNNYLSNNFSYNIDSLIIKIEIITNCIINNYYNEIELEINSIEIILLNIKSLTNEFEKYNLKLNTNFIQLNSLKHNLKLFLETRNNMSKYIEPIIKKIKYTKKIPDNFDELVNGSKILKKFDILKKINEAFLDQKFIFNSFKASGKKRIRTKKRVRSKNKK